MILQTARQSQVVPTDYTHNHLNKREFKIVLAEMKMPKLHSSQTIPVTVIVSIPEFLSKRNSNAFQVQAVQTQGYRDPYLSYSELLSLTVLKFTIIL